MKAFELNMKDLLKILPKKALDEILEKLEKHRIEPGKIALERLKRFVKEWSQDSKLDCLLVHLLDDVMTQSVIAIGKEQEKSRDRGEDSLCGHYIAEAVVKQLRKIANNIEKLSQEDHDHICNQDD